MKAIKKLIKNKKTAVFLDFEGTQFSHEIIAIGAVKCPLNQEGQIVRRKKYPTFKILVKPVGPVGKIVRELTGIEETALKDKGVPFEEALSEFVKFIGVPLYECAYITFGSNDARMIEESIRYSRPSNAEDGITIIRNIIDYLPFITQYSKDENGNNYSLVSYLKLFGGTPEGISHDPLNDALDLMNLYRLFITNEEIRLQEYLKVLKKMRSIPEPARRIISDLIDGKEVKTDEFISYIKEYLK